MTGWLRETWPRGAGRRAAVLLALAGSIIGLVGSAHAASLASCSNGCLLAWTVQPSNAKVTDTITDTPFSAESGAPSSSVQVTVVDNNGHTVTNARGTVSLARTTNAGVFDNPPCASFLSNASVSLSQGTATFTGLSANCSGKLFTLTATSSAGYTSAVSGSFSIFQTYVPCDTSNPNCRSTLNLGGNGNAGLTTSTSGAFTFIALAGGAQVKPDSGCENWKGPFTNGFREVDQSGGNGTTKTFTYFVSQSLLKAKYGKNTGQQFVPLCAGGEAFVAGVPAPCWTGPATGGWWGESLNADGTISGILKQASCNGDGLWWGFMPSFQDFNNPNFGGLNTPPPSDFSWSTNPVVTGWSSCTAGSTCPVGVGTAGTTYRSFSLSVPYPWDWGGGM